MSESPSPYWWLNSGGVMHIRDNTGSTNEGEMPTLSKWRLLYKISNPRDTDNGYHPQNIFRLISRNIWQNFSESSYFRIVEENLSESYNRNVSNGLLLMSRYQDNNNLYYAGVRVDGTAVIKRKREGEYITLAQKKIFAGEYDRVSNPNLLPKNKWIGVRSDIKNYRDTVVIYLYVDLDNNGHWLRVLEAVDIPSDTGGVPIYQGGFAGIRTDFMDVEFRDFRVLDM